MKKKLLLLLCFALVISTLVACTSEPNTNTGDETKSPENAKPSPTPEATPSTTPEASKTSNPPSTPTYTQITQEKAKEMMDTLEDYIILDVRTEQEYDMGHIPGAKLIPVDDIKEKAPGTLTDKNAIILVYCRSGNRSKTASQALAEMGYVNVYEFGGITTWEYEITK